MDLQKETKNVSMFIERKHYGNVQREKIMYGCIRKERNIWISDERKQCMNDAIRENAIFRF